MKELKVDLKITPAVFVKDTGESVKYYNTEIILASGANIKIKISNDTANLLYNGYLS